MRRGDLVVAAIPGDYGKPRPAVIVQGDAFAGIASVTLVPLSSDLQPVPLLRLTVEPSPANGLQARSQIMIDKVVTVPRARIGRRIGRLDDGAMREVGRALSRFLELG
jgi:mRNA interferase MazF